MAQVEDFLKYIRYELNLSTHTVSAYKKDLEQFAIFLSSNGEDIRWAEVTVNDIRSWMVEMSGSGMSQRSIRRKIQSLRAMYRWMMRRGMIADSPAEEIEPAKFDSRLPVYVRPADMEAVLNDSDVDPTSFEQVRNHLMVDMLDETGMRRAELISLTDANVDTSRCEMKVHGKRNKDRIIPFGTALAADIEQYRRIRNKEVGHTTEFFVTAKGRALYPTLVYNVVTTALADIPLEHRSPHVLRHSFASAMLNDGAELNSVKELLGHSSLEATQIYTHVTMRELKQNYQQAHPRAIKKGG